MKRLPAINKFVAPLLLCTHLLFPATAWADDALSTISVNGSETKDFSGELVGDDTAKGVAIAGAKIYFGNDEDYQVNRGPANAVEKAALQAVADLAKATAVTDANARADAIRKFRDGAKEKTKPVAGANPAFVEIAKVIGLSANTKVVSNEFTVERAVASALQTLEKIPRVRYVTSDLVSTRVRKGIAEPPTAVAFTVNRDPFAITWSSPSERNVKVDLSDVSFTLETRGDAIAVSTLNSDGAFINGITDINAPESMASPLYELLIPVVSIDGSAPFIDFGAFEFVVFGNEVFDSLGNVGIDAVTDGLLGSLGLINGDTIGFLSPYSFSVTVPGTSENSVIWVRDIVSGAVIAVPEPPMVLLVGMGLVVLLVRARARTT